LPRRFKRILTATSVVSPWNVVVVSAATGWGSR
jgi:hypothetical protein